MKPGYLQSDSNRDRWTISYVDVLTILLIFFIAVAAKQPPKPAPAAVSKVAAANGPLAGARELLVQQGLDAKLEERGLVVSLPQMILFGSGDDRITEDALPVIERIAGVIGKLSNHIVLCGHADAAPIHNRRFKNNWELSAARSLRLLELLTERYGIDESRLSVSSDGANRPVASNETADGRANNRRVEIVIER